MQYINAYMMEMYCLVRIIYPFIYFNDYKMRPMGKFKEQSSYHDFSHWAGFLLLAGTSPSALGLYGWREPHTVLPKGKEIMS